MATRNLTLAQALSNHTPEKLTKEEWKAMHYASLLAEQDAKIRHQNALFWANLAIRARRGVPQETT